MRNRNLQSSKNQLLLLNINCVGSVEVLSILATVLSILALIKEIIIPLVFRPKIELLCEKENELPYLADDEPSNNKLLEPIALGGKRIYYYYRICVFNSRTPFTSTAYNLYARILAIKRNDIRLGRFNTILMRWTTNNFYETLSRGEHLLLNLCTVVYDYNANGNEERHLILPGHTGGLQTGLAAGFKINELTDGKYEYEIGVYGKSIAGKQYKIVISFGSSKGEPDVKITCCKLSQSRIVKIIKLVKASLS